MITERLAELEERVAVLQFALSRLWLREFERHQNPLEAAKTYARELDAVFSNDGPPEFEGTRDLILGFFEQLVVELGCQKGTH
jgi:hypothetical protein